MSNTLDTEALDPDSEAGMTNAVGKQTLHRYRLAGVVGGLLLGAGQFYSPLCVLQLAAMVPLMVLVLRDRKISWAAMSGFYMGIAYTIPQMIYLLMPIPVTVVLLVYMTTLLVGLCVLMAVLLPRHPVLGAFGVGAVWYVLDWVNYSSIPIWGMAQSFGRSWSGYPFVIGFISVTGISGVLFVIGTAQGLIAHGMVDRTRRQRSLVVGGVLVAVIMGLNIVSWFERPDGSLRIAAAGWVFDDRFSEINPNTESGFERLFAEPAKKAAAEGARLFTTGEMGFYIADHEREERIDPFRKVAIENDLWLVVGYFNIGDDENRIFFMSPDGEIVGEYTKTYLTPYEPGKAGCGDLQTINVNGYTVGAMICQDDNFSRLTRYYGKLKADVVLCPTADWWTIKAAHLQAVKARAIECNYGIVRGAACGISAVISPRGEIMEKWDHYRNGPGYVVADVPVRGRKTVFARFGHWPGLIIAGMIIATVFVRKIARKKGTQD